MNTTGQFTSVIFFSDLLVDMVQPGIAYIKAHAGIGVSQQVTLAVSCDQVLPDQLGQKLLM